MITPAQPGDVTSWLGITTRLPSPFTNFTIGGIFRLSTLAAAARTFFYIGNDAHAAGAPYIRVGTSATDGLTPKLTLYNGSTTWTSTAADPLVVGHNYLIFLIKTGTQHDVYVEDFDVTLTPTLVCTLTHDTTATPTHLYTCVNSSTAVCNVRAYVTNVAPADVVTDARVWLHTVFGTSPYLSSTFRVPGDLQDQLTFGANTDRVVPPDSSFAFSRHNWTSDGNPLQFATDPDDLVSQPCYTWLSPASQTAFYDIPPGGTLPGFGSYQVSHAMSGPMVDEGHLPTGAAIQAVEVYNAGALDPGAAVLGPCEATYGLAPTSTILPGCITITDGVTTAAFPNESFPSFRFFTGFFGCVYSFDPATEIAATNPLTGLTWTATDLYSDTLGFILPWKNLGAFPEPHCAAFRVADINLLVTYVLSAEGLGTIIVVKEIPPGPDVPTFTFTTANLTPASFTLVPDASQTFSSLTPADNYAIFETPPPGWTQTAVTVSNGSPVTGITVAADEVVTVTFRNAAIPLPVVTEAIRRERIGPHLVNERKRMIFSRAELQLETGVGLNAGQGVDPQVMLSYSDDGGHTWSTEHWTSAGAIGSYQSRAFWVQLGQSRDRVFKIVTSDPVAFRLIAMFLNVQQGTN